MRAVFRTASAKATEELGRRIGRAVGDPPLVIGLAGPLGAGKTCLVRGLVAGIGSIDAREVCSPTYAIANVYRAARPIHHLDLYRLQSDDDLESVAFAEMLEDYVLIEWFDRLASVARHLDVVIVIERRGLRARTLTLEARTPRGARLLESLGQAASN